MAAQRRESYRFRIAAFFCGLGIMSSMVERKVRKIKGLMPPEHLRNHTLLFEPGLIPPDVGEALRVAIKKVSSEGGGMPSNARDTNFYSPKHEHIGEARPRDPLTGECDHPFLVPSKNGSLCVLAGRLDIGRHFITTGGLDALRESYDTLVSRVLSFGVYLFGSDVPSAVRGLFSDERFVALARKICPTDRQYLDPFQSNFIVQVPGQTVAAHLDGVYFWGADRFQFPQWLLAAMQFSNLFADRFVHQVQVVGYLHEWQPSSDRAGEFVFWDGSTRLGIKEDPLPLAGSAVDGTKTVHAATVYMPQEQPPAIDKDLDTRLFYNSAGGKKARGGKSAGGSEKRWQLRVGDEVLRNYTTDDLRMSIVYRARCFRDAAEAKKFNAQLADGRPPERGSGQPQPPMELEDVLRVFAEDLVKRGKVQSLVYALDPSWRLEFALLIMDTYIKYPLPTRPGTLILKNYCALPRTHPWTKPFLSLICR